jgi:hypothetical protein
MVSPHDAKTKRLGGPLTRLWLAGAFSLFRLPAGVADPHCSKSTQRVTGGQEQSPQYVVDKCPGPQDVAPLVQPLAKIHL